ncbi:MAG: CBS domain-containing protein [Nitrospira sp.]|nr:CBS domain-containing protein [Nitrospira sp.]
MPTIPPMKGIAETPPVQAVSHRQSATQNDGNRRGDSKEEKPERQATTQATILAQQAYQQSVNRVSAPKPALLAQDLMTSPVTWLPSDGTLLEAWTVMKRKGIHHLPVTSIHGALVGLVSDRDLLPYAQDLESAGSPGPSTARRLALVMNHRVLSASPTTELRDIARVMLDEHASAILIVDGARHPVGILTTSDILHAIVRRSPLELWT